MRRPIIAGNWKMNLSFDEARDLAIKIKNEILEPVSIDIVFTPPFTSLDMIHRRIEDNQIMLKAQEAAIETLGPGVKCSDVDKASMKVISNSGYNSLMRHHTGHGIGLEGHEPPWLDIGNEAELKPGMVVSIEPGIYELGFAGFRHSDTAVITEDGYELVTYYPRDLESLTIL